MYYIVNEATNHIIESQASKPTQAELIDIANFMQCDVYVISGEHAGMTASPDESMVLIDDLDEDDAEYDEEGFEIGWRDRGVTETFGNQ